MLMMKYIELRIQALYELSLARMAVVDKTFMAVKQKHCLVLPSHWVILMMTDMPILLSVSPVQLIRLTNWVVLAE